MPLPILPIAAGVIGAIGAGRAALDQREEPEEPAIPQPARQSVVSSSITDPSQRRLIEDAYRQLGLPTHRDTTPAPAPVREPESPGFVGTAGDLAVSATAGALDAASGISNLASTIPRGYNLPEPFSAISEGLGGAADVLRERGLSPAAQASAAQFSADIAANSEGTILQKMGGVGKAVIDNPRHTANIGAEMLPLMIGGGLAGRALVKGTGVSPVVGAGAGEGTIAAGMGSEGIREATDGDNPFMELGGGLAIGAFTGAVPIAGASIFTRMAKSGAKPVSSVGKFFEGTDPETLLAGGVRKSGQEQRILSRVASGAIREGALEELPQTIGETGIQNVASDKPFSEGLVEDATLGTILGGIMGGAFNIPGGARAPAAAGDIAPEEAVEPLTAEAFPKPERAPPKIWEGVTAGIIESDARTQEAVDAVLEATGGMGPKRSAEVRETEWYQALPSTTEAAPTETTVAPAEETAGPTLDVEPNAAEEAADAETDAGYAADIAAVLDDDAELKSEIPTALESETPTETPVEQLSGRLRQHPRYNIHRALYQLINGVFPNSDVGTKAVKDKSGGQRQDTSAWRRAANITSAVFSPLDTTDLLNEGETTLDLANRIVKATLRLEQLGNYLGSESAVLKLNEDGNIGRQSKATETALVEGAGKDAGIGTAELDIFASFDDAVVRNPKEDTETQESYEARIMGDVLSNTSVPLTELRESYASKGKALDTMFTQLETLAGQENILLAMYAGKKAQFGGTTRALPGSRLDSESSEAVRFGQFYRKFRKNPDGSGAFTTPAQSKAAPLRQESGLARKLEHLSEKENPSPLERIARGATLLPNAPKDRSRVHNVLTHYRVVTQNPVTKRVAGALLRVLEANNLHLADGDTRINIVDTGVSGVNADTGFTQEGAFLHTPAGELNEGIDEGFIGPLHPDYVGVVTINTQGRNETTILHEIIHALTVSMMVRNPTNAGVLNMRAVAKHIVTKWGTIGGTQQAEKQYGKATANVIRILTKHQRSEFPIVAGIELIAEALTDPDFQLFLKSEAYEGPKLAGLSPRTLWQAFRMAISNMLGAGRVPGNMLDEVLGASAAILHDSAVGTQLGRPNVKAPVDPLEASKPYPGTPSATASDPKAKADSDARRSKESTSSASKKGSADKTAKQAKRIAKAKEEKLAQELAPQTEAFRRQEQGTAVDTTGKAPSRNRSPLDAAMRNVMDGVMGLFSGNDHADWEAGMKELLSKGWEALVKWASQQNNPAQRFVIAVLIGTVDGVGVNPQALNEIARASAMRHGGNHSAVTAFQNLHDASPEIQQAALDYMTSRDKAALEQSIVGENAKNTVEHVIKVVESLETLALKLATIGKLDGKYIDQTDPANPRVDLRTLLSPSRGKNVKLGGAQITGSLRAHKINSLIERVPNTERIIGTQGTQILKPQPGQRFWRAHAKDGDVYFVDTRAKPSVLTALDLRPDANDTESYRIDGKLGSDADARMTRHKNATELREGKLATEALPAMINTAHEWTRLLSYNALTDQLIADSENLADDAKYVLDDESMEASEILDHKRLTLEKIQDEGRGFGSAAKRLTKAARVPGTWVKIPDEGGTSQQWGDMAGMWVAGPVYASMQDQASDNPVIDSANFRAFMRVWKKNKTVWSPGTHVQNVMGNMVLLYMHDIPYSHVRQSYGLLLKDWAEENRDKFKWAKNYIERNPLSAEDRVLVDEFLASGATLGQFKTADFDISSFTEAVAHTEEISGEDEGSPKGLISGLMGMEGLLTKAISGLSATDDILMDMYSNQDNIFRMAGYMTHIQRAVENSPDGQSTAQMKEAAAKYASESFVNYNVTAPWVRAMRGTITPFIMFPYRMVPIVTKLAITKPWKTATVLGSIYALNALGYALGGGDEDEERSLMQDYMNESVWGASFPNVPTYVRLPFGDENNPVFLPLGGLVPVATALTLDPNGTPRMFAPSGPAFTAIAAAWGYDPFLKRDIRNEAATTTENIAATAGYLFRGLAPQVAVSITKGVDNQIWDGGKVGQLGAEPSAYLDMAKVLGITMKQMNIPEARVHQSQAVSRIKSDFGRARNSYMRQHLRRGDPNPQDLQDYLIQNAEALHEAIIEELE